MPTVPHRNRVVRAGDELAALPSAGANAISADFAIAENRTRTSNLVKVLCVRCPAELFCVLFIGSSGVVVLVLDVAGGRCRQRASRSEQPSSVAAVRRAAGGQTAAR